MPTVRPRLPFIFEPDKGIGRSPATFGERAGRVASGPVESSPDGASMRRAQPAAALPAAAATVLTTAPHRIPLNAAEPARQPPPPAATVGVAPTRSPSVAVDTSRAHEDRPQAPELAAPRRTAPVAIRPVIREATQPPRPTSSRRGTGTPSAEREAPAERAAGPNVEPPAPPTVHVHIGRVEVRAGMPPATPSRSADRPTAPRTTLEDYLSGRKGGSQP